MGRKFVVLHCADCMSSVRYKVVEKLMSLNYHLFDTLWIRISKPKFLVGLSSSSCLD